MWETNEVLLLVPLYTPTDYSIDTNEFGLGILTIINVLFQPCVY